MIYLKLNILINKIAGIKKFGNCCKVPLSINRKNGRFCEILDDFIFLDVLRAITLKIAAIKRTRPKMPKRSMRISVSFREDDRGRVCEGFPMVKPFNEL